MRLGAAAFALAGCSRDNGNGSGGATSLDAGAADVVDAATSVSTNDHLAKAPDAAAGERHTLMSCRVVDASGTPDSVVPGAYVPNGWITIAAGGKLTVRHPRSTRESTFVGPAEVVPCVGSRELHWLKNGTFKSAPGSGESPGHEAWVVTPLGVVRYGVAGLTVQMDTHDAKNVVETIRVASGSARVWHPSVSATVTARLDKASQKKTDAGANGDKAPLAWTRLVDGTSMTLSGAGQMDTSADCFADAEIAAVAARALRPAAAGAADASAVDAGDFGDRAAHDLEAIEATRAACAVATMTCPPNDASCPTKIDAALLHGETGNDSASP